MNERGMKKEDRLNNSADSKKVIAIVGPTASGKTSLGIHLAQRLAQMGEPAEIINADAYQMYRGMDIGTAKASIEEQSAVPHHLLDIIDPEETMSVARFQQLARQCIRDLKARGVRPILVGGSGLYARAAVDDITFPPTDSSVRARLEERARLEGASVLFAELQAKDPVAAQTMDPSNPRRTIRALEVIELTGRPYSATLPKYRYVIPCVQIGLDLKREHLDERVELRTTMMREQGFVDEVRAIRNRLGVTASRALGYPQIMDYLDGKCTEDEAFADIAQKTRRLARKQMGWFGRDARIHWLDALREDIVDAALAIVKAEDAALANDGQRTENINAACSLIAVENQDDRKNLDHASFGTNENHDDPFVTQHHLGDIA